MAKNKAIGPKWVHFLKKIVCSVRAYPVCGLGKKNLVCHFIFAGNNQNVKSESFGKALDVIYIS